MGVLVNKARNDAFAALNRSALFVGGQSPDLYVDGVGGKCKSDAMSNKFTFSINASVKVIGHMATLQMMARADSEMLPVGRIENRMGDIELCLLGDVKSRHRQFVAHYG